MTTTKADAKGSYEQFGLLLDVPVQVTVELGRRTVPIGDVVQLGPGSVIELGKAAGESLDILVNGKLVARGEAVVVGEKYGVRIVEVIGAADLAKAEGRQTDA
jgi:flagellar motor switch protein FliN/FliY